MSKEDNLAQGVQTRDSVYDFCPDDAKHKNNGKKSKPISTYNILFRHSE